MRYRLIDIHGRVVEEHEAGWKPTDAGRVVLLVTALKAARGGQGPRAKAWSLTLVRGPAQVAHAWWNVRCDVGAAVRWRELGLIVVPV